MPSLNRVTLKFGNWKPVVVARKDTISLLPGWKAEVLVRFRDFTGEYLMHCHQHAHEDHAMMIRFDVVP